MCNPEARPELIQELALRNKIFMAYPSDTLAAEMEAIEDFLREQFGRMPQPDTQEMN